jgi:hypothetical protein
LSPAEDNVKKSKITNRETKKTKNPFEIRIEERDEETETKVLKFIIKGPEDGELATWEEDVKCLYCRQRL